MHGECVGTMVANAQELWSMHGECVGTVVANAQELWSMHGKCVGTMANAQFTLVETVGLVCKQHSN